MNHPRKYAVLAYFSLFLLLSSMSVFSQWSWKQATIPATLKPQRANHGMLSFDNKLWIFSGAVDLANHDVWARNIINTADGSNWAVVADPAPYQQATGAQIGGYYDCAVFNGYMWIIGGGQIMTG